MSNIPKCCGLPMSARVDTPLYLEVECKKCGDVVYVKKAKIQKPTMLDD